MRYFTGNPFNPKNKTYGPYITIQGTICRLGNHKDPDRAAFIIALARTLAKKLEVEFGDHPDHKMIFLRAMCDLNNIFQRPHDFSYSDWWHCQSLTFTRVLAWYRQIRGLGGE